MPDSGSDPPPDPLKPPVIEVLKYLEFRFDVAADVFKLKIGFSTPLFPRPGTMEGAKLPWSGMGTILFLVLLEFKEALRLV